MKFVFTGGHLSPLLSVISKLDPGDSVLVIGRKHALEGDAAQSLEYKTLKENNIQLKTIITGRFQRRLTRYTFLSLLKFPYGFFQSFLILKKYQPDAILSFGGYVSLPVIFSGFILGIPVVIHEQTLEAGFSNKIASFFARKICISWDSSRKFFPSSKTILTGNPIREFEISSRDKFQISNEDRKKQIIYITGGSLGSHKINLLVEGCIKNLLKKNVVIHQTGDAQKYQDFKHLWNLRESLSNDLKKRYFLTKFIKPQEVGPVIKKADLIISRSGMNTIGELIFFGKPSLLIPLAFSQGQEQMKNAKFLKSLGLGEVCEDEDITSDKFYQLIESMLKNLEEYKKSGKLAKNFIFQDSAKKIMEVLKKESKKAHEKKK